MLVMFPGAVLGLVQVPIFQGLKQNKEQHRIYLFLLLRDVEGSQRTGLMWAEAKRLWH